MGLNFLFIFLRARIILVGREPKTIARDEGSTYNTSRMIDLISCILLAFFQLRIVERIRKYTIMISDKSSVINADVDLPRDDATSKDGLVMGVHVHICKTLREMHNIILFMEGIFAIIADKRGSINHFEISDDETVHQLLFE